MLRTERSLLDIPAALLKSTTPRIEWLCVWIINTEDTDTLLDPVEDHSLQFFAELGSVFTLEVNG